MVTDLYVFIYIMETEKQIQHKLGKIRERYLQTELGLLNPNGARVEHFGKTLNLVFIYNPTMGGFCCMELPFEFVWVENRCVSY